jgi:hypothetical protein
MTIDTSQADFCPIDIVERNAYNAAFSELGLRFRWGNDTLAELSDKGDERSRVRHYLRLEQPHLLQSYEAEFLIDAILKAKQEQASALRRAGIAAADERKVPSHEAHSAEIGF